MSEKLTPRWAEPLNMTSFKSTVLILPGLGNSGEGHWQTLWQKEFNFERIEQRDWDFPVLEDWVGQIDRVVSKHNSRNCILVGHSLACSAIGYWSLRTNYKIKGALLVAPSDTEAPSYPQGTKGFAPMPMSMLPFASITVASTNDFYVTQERAIEFAAAWGSKLISIGSAGHINVAAGFGPWPEGLTYLRELDEL